MSADAPTFAIFWYGAQTYIASTAVALLIGTFVAADGGATFLGMTVDGNCFTPV